MSDAPSERDAPELRPGDQPTKLAQDGPDHLVIHWSHGPRTRYPVRAIRLACKCAQCVDEWSNEPLLDPQSVPRDVRPLRIEPVGRYGLQIEWSDGHGTGIYTFDTLWALAASAGEIIHE